MRDAFNDELHRIAARDKDVLLLTADIGFKVFDRFRADYPGRFINVGVAEANMVGMAAGLALSGKHPFVYTIIPFLTMRAFEQIRVDVSIQNAPVKIVGVGGGLAYGNLGPTHHALTDIAILRALPNMVVLVPCDPMEAQLATRAAFEHPGPAYVRLGKNGEPPVHGARFGFRLGRAVELHAGDDAAIIASGPVVGVALAAARELEATSGVRARVLDMHTVKPIDGDAIRAAAAETGAIVSLEEHNVIGGLGSAVAEVLAESGAGVPFRRLGVADRFSYEVGSQAYHWAQHGLTATATATAVRELLAWRVPGPRPGAYA